MSSLVIRVMSQGERAPLLLDHQGLPLFYPTLFATAQLRNAGAAVNTIRNALTHIQVLLRWETQEGRNLVDEFTSGALLSLPDILSLRDFAKLDMRYVGAREGTGGRSGKVVALSDARIGPMVARPSVTQRVAYNRMTTIADYLEFLGGVIIQHRNSAELALDLAEMCKRIRKHRPRGSKHGLIETPADKSPDPGVVKRLREVIAIGSDENPFSDPTVQLRNAVIIELYRITGMRTGELLSLWVEQFHLGHEPSVSVRRNHDDVLDPRAYQPTSKTKERVLPISDELAKLVQHYILEVRARIPGARRHPYVFVSHKVGKTLGRPLSKNGLYRIIERVSVVSPELAGIHPHALRHHMNYALSLAIDQHNAASLSNDAEKIIREGREQDIRAHLNGHRNKESGKVYNERHIREQADKAMRLLGSALPRKNDTKVGDEGKR